MNINMCAAKIVNDAGPVIVLHGTVDVDPRTASTGVRRAMDLPRETCYVRIYDTRF